MANADTIITKARLRLDDAVTTYQWSDAELVDNLNDSRNEMVNTGKLLKDKDTSAICDIAITAGTEEYTLDSRIIQVIEARLTTAKVTLGFTDELDLQFKLGDAWRDATGTPSYCIADIVRKKFTLYPNPDEDDTANLFVYRMPVTQITTGNMASTDTEVPVEYENHLVTGILSYCYTKNDSDTIDLANLKTYVNLWEILLEKLRRDFILRRSIPRVNTIPKGLL